MGGPLCHVTTRSHYASRSVHSQDLKKITSAPGSWLTPLSDLICPACHCFGFAVFNDTFSTIQNIYLTFSAQPKNKKNIFLTTYYIILLKSMYSFYSSKILTDYFSTIKIILRFLSFQVYFVLPLYDINVLNGNILGSEFELQSFYYVNFRTNTLRRGMNLRFTPSYKLTSANAVLLKGWP